jgi:hypothetical protein
MHLQMARTQKNKATSYHLGQLKVMKTFRFTHLQARLEWLTSAAISSPAALPLHPTLPPLQAKLAKLRTEIQEGSKVCCTWQAFQCLLEPEFMPSCCAVPPPPFPNTLTCRRVYPPATLAPG